MEIPELANTETDPPQNPQDNGAMPPVSTQQYPPHSPLEDTLVTSAEPLPRPHVKSGDAALQARAGDLLYVCLLGANYMLYGVYQGWVTQNTGEHLDGGIKEDSKWQAKCKKIFCMPTQLYYASAGKVRNIFFGIVHVELDGVHARKWNIERVIFFQSFILKHAQGVNNSAQICKHTLF